VSHNRIKRRRRMQVTQPDHSTEVWWVCADDDDGDDPNPASSVIPNKPSARASETGYGDGANFLFWYRFHILADHAIHSRSFVSGYSIRECRFMH
jgi:hypothetical protein